MTIVKKIKAGALQFVLFIGAVVAILLMAFVLLSYTQSYFAKKTDLVIAVVKSASFGMDVSLDKKIPLEESIPIPSENKLGIEIKVGRELWGIFEKRTVTAVHGNIGTVKTALVGGAYSDEIPALYVKDQKRPMVIAGNAKITGAAYLPEKGLKAGNIYGNSYNRSQLVYGRTFQSDSVLPTIDDEIKQQIKTLTSMNYVPEGKLVTTFPEKELKNSFQSPTMIMQGHEVRLKDIALSGNIIISASHKIVVEASAKLQDVLLIAPKIEIKNWVKGTFQALANTQITVGKKCELYYPSALVVQKKTAFNIPSSTVNPHSTSSTYKPSIYMDSYAEVGGVVAFLDDVEQQLFAPQIKIEENAKVTGEVYCAQNLELKGRVNGAVCTGAFMALENGSIYQNHLYDGLVNSQNLHASYCGLLMDKSDRTKKVMKWLY
ncbi:hypothetical protein [Maribacter sp. 2210JD10-5]|uniref:hypothetical protein n=1 Tax=Maribacter sp. 2210JD10-5 TaxID=3386272 RepID=UPI0039BC4AD3